MDCRRADTFGEPTDATAASPIGVFDSGIGGLSVIREMRALMPDEQVIFIADSDHAPYGDRSRQYIQHRSLTIARFLHQRGAKAIVIACNTATAAAAEALRRESVLPVIGMEPAVRSATAATTTGVVGVLATTGTLESARFAALLARFGDGVEVVTRRAPDLVESVEAGAIDGPQVRALAQIHVEHLVAAGADTIVLGSTHFAFLRPLVEELAGADATVIDTGAPVTLQLRHVLKKLAITSAVRPSPDAEFWTSGDPRKVQRAAAGLLGERLGFERLPSWYL